jgi:Methyltransferase domain
MVSIYENQQYIHQNESWHIEDSPWKAQKIYKLLNENSICPQTCCEIGCGAGEILVQLSKLMAEETTFMGYDISPQLEILWEERKNQKISFSKKNFMDCDNYYDVLMCIDVVEHIEDYIGFLRKIKDKGNYKIFNFPLEIFAVKALLAYKFIDSKKKYGHLHYFNKEICIEVLKDLDFKIIDYFYASGSMDLASVSSSLSQSSKLLNIPRFILSKISVDLTAKLLGGYSLFILAQ